jgi:hypothetical protein
MLLGFCIGMGHENSCGGVPFTLEENLIMFGIPILWPLIPLIGLFFKDKKRSVNCK